MKHLILVDGNNWGFSGMSVPKLSTGDKDTQGTFHFLKRLRFAMEQNPDALFMILWDGRSWRKDLYTDYKANRERTAKQTQERNEYYDQKKDIQEALKLLGIMQVSADNMEADDLAEIFSRKWKGDRITLLSGDMDWLQLVDEKTVWHDLISERRATQKIFKQFTGCENFVQFLEKKCILGDTGDNIKGINGIGPKKVETIFELFESFYAMMNYMEMKPGHVDEVWLKQTGKNLPKVIRELDITQARETMEMNMKLMWLSTPHRPEPVNLVKIRGSLDPEKFTDFCGRLAFMSILRDFNKFLLPFKENQYVSK